MKTEIKIKFKKGIGIGLPNGGLLYPNLYATGSKKGESGEGNFPLVVDTPVGQAPIQKYHLDKDIYTIKLEEEEKEIPEHIASLGEDVKKSFLKSFAKKLAEAHEANNITRKALQYYADQGHIEILSDSFLDKKNPKKPPDKEIPKEAVKVEPPKVEDPKPTKLEGLKTEDPVPPSFVAPKRVKKSETI